jgi:hypothetical protein
VGVELSAALNVCFRDPDGRPDDIISLAMLILHDETIPRAALQFTQFQRGGTGANFLVLTRA